MGSDGVAALQAVRSRLNTLSDEQWTTILTVNGKNVKATIDAKVGRSGTAQQIISDLVAIVYGTDEELQQKVNEFRAEFADEFDALFGTQLTVDKLFQFFNEFEKEFEAQVIASVIVGDNDLDAVIRETVHAAAAKTRLDGALYSALGIGVDDVLKIKDNINNAVDPDKRARQALVMGLAKYKNIAITGPSTVTVGQTERYKISTVLNGEPIETSGGVEWRTSNSNVATISANGQLTARAAGTVNVEAWMLGYKIAEKEVTVVAAGAGGGGGAAPGPVMPPGVVVEKEIVGDKDVKLENADGTLVVEIPAGAVEPVGGKPVKVTFGTLKAEEAQKRVEAIEKVLAQRGLQKASDRFHIVKTVFTFKVTDAGGKDVALKKKVVVKAKVDLSGLDAKVCRELVSLYRVVGVSAQAAASNGFVPVSLQPVLEYVPSKLVGDTLVAKIDASGEYVVAARVKTFADVTAAKYPWAKNEIELLAAKEIIKGRTETQFAPQEAITRAEFTALLVRLLDVKAAGTAKMDFVDFDAKAWYADELKAAVEIGLLKGDGGKKTIRPNAPIRRVEMAAIVARALAYAKRTQNVEAHKAIAVFTDAAAIPSWAHGDVAQAVVQGLVKGYPDKTFRPAGLATRAEAAVMVKRFFDMY